MTAEWREALLELETNPDLDPAERHRLANAVRDDAEAFERAVDAGQKRGAQAVKEVFAPAGPRERSVLAWQRGTSLSFRVDGPHDAAWLEALFTEPPKAFRLRPEAQSAQRLENDREKAWKTGVRVRVHPGAAVLGTEKLDIELELGDWLVMSPRARNLGGHTGRAFIATFSYGELRAVGGEGEEEETDGQTD